MPDNHRNSESLLIMQYSSNMVTNCIYKSMYGPVQCHFPSQFLSMQLNCNPSFDQVHVSDQFRKLSTFSRVLMGLLKGFPFLKIELQCSNKLASLHLALFFLYPTQAFLHLTPVVQCRCISLQCFSVKTAASSSKVASGSRSVIDFHFRSKHLICLFR